MMVIENKFNIEQIVYLKTDSDQKEGIVTSISVRKNQLSYEIAFGMQVSWHYDFEISEEKNVLKTLNE